MCQMEMEDPFLSDLTMPGKLEISNGYADDLEELHQHGGSSDAHIWPYNERLTNATNATIAAAMSGRSNRTHFAAASRAPFAGRQAASLQQGPGKVLDLLRRTLQKFVNQEIHTLLQKYVKDYFEPAMDNMRSNSGPDFVNEDHLNEVLCSVLEEAKQMYEPPPPPLPLPPPPPSTLTYPASGSPYSNISEEPFARYGERRGSDGSYSSGSSVKRQKTEVEKKPKSKLATVVRKTPATAKVWSGVVDMDSIDENTKFILGSAANKILGYAAARGRIYVKYPDLFKYVGDQEDKQWLFENKIMTAAGGKAFLVFSDDIKELLKTDDASVKRLPFGTAKEFSIPPFMLKKLQRAAAEFSSSTEGARSRSGSNVSNVSGTSSGASGASGTSGASGASGISGASGASGTSGVLREEADGSPSPSEVRVEGTSSSGQDQHGDTGDMHYGDTVDGRSDPFNGSDSPGGFFSPLNDRDVFDNDNDVFARDDHEFSSGLSLDAINPTIGVLDHAHELHHLDY